MCKFWILFTTAHGVCLLLLSRYYATAHGVCLLLLRLMNFFVGKISLNRPVVRMKAARPVVDR